MSIEHSDISFGEMHPVANWVLTSGGAAALGSIAVSDADIGKVAWVAGVGHFVLATVAPTLWETLGLTLTSAVYADPTLTLTFSDASVIDVEIPSMSAAQVQTYVEGVLANYVTGSAHTAAIDTINTALSGKEPTIAAGTSSQYWRGDKTWQELSTSAVAESTDRLFVSSGQKARVTTAASSTASGYLTSTDWSTFNGKQSALADVITANSYGSSTQYPIVTVNAKGIVTGITLQTVPTPTFTDATFSVQKNGSPAITAKWNLTAFTASHTHTYPNKDINFGDLPSIATTNGNNLSGTRCRILGGSSNTVSGSDVVAVGCNNCDLSMYTTGVTAIGLQGTTNLYAVAPRQAILLGSSALTTSIFNISGAHAAALGVIQCVYSAVCAADGTTFNATLDGANTPSSTNCIKLLPAASALSSAVIDLDFIIVIGDNMYGTLLTPRRTVFAKRRVYIVFAFNTSDVGAFSSSVEVIGTDTSVGSAATGTVTVGVTVDSANNRLIPTVSATSGSKQTFFQFGVRSTAHYNRNV